MKIFLQALFFILLITQNCLAQWVQTNGPNGLYVFAFADSDTNLFAGTANGGTVFRSTNNGTSWAQTSLITIVVYSLTVSDTNLFAGTLTDGVFRSTDNGTSWIQVNTHLTNSAVLTLAVSDTNLFAGTLGGGIFRSTDNGSYWTQINNGLTNTYVTDIVVSDTNIFAGTEVGIFRSTNNGTSWTAINNGLTYTYVRTLAVSNTNLFAGMAYYGGVYCSTNNGISWTQTSLTNIDVRAFAVSGTNLFAGTESGIFLSTNNGMIWTQVNEGLAYTSVWALVISSFYLLAGTYEGGVWRRPLSEMITKVESNDQLPIKFLLSQNFPNPFNPSTKIKYSIPPIGTQHAVSVQIKVYDVLGNEIETLVNEEKSAGTYEITWYAEQMPSGVYFYRLQAGDFISSKKMILLK